MRSLVVEDDATSRLLLRKVLEKHGDCDIAVDGQEAIKAVSAAIQKRRNYDLICMDLRMPGLDGHEAIRVIREMETRAGLLKSIRIIVITSLTDMTNITQALLGKCNAYLMKPIDLGKLRDELEELGLVKQGG